MGVVVGGWRQGKGTLRVAPGLKRELSKIKSGVRKWRQCDRR